MLVAIVPCQYMVLLHLPCHAVQQNLYEREEAFYDDFGFVSLVGSIAYCGTMSAPSLVSSAPVVELGQSSNSVNWCPLLFSPPGILDWSKDLQLAKSQRPDILVRISERVVLRRSDES